MTVVDVVVVSYNSRGLLRSTVRDLSGLPGLRVLVVDSASFDGTLETVADLPLSAVALDENRGFGYACNVGWRLGNAPSVLFLNPDATIDESSVMRLVDTADSSPGIGAVAPRIVDRDGRLDFSMRRFPRLRSTYAQALFIHRMLLRATWTDELVREEAAYDHAASPDWVSGACILVKRDVLETLGGFDEGFFMYCEDVDLCRRIRTAGLDVRFEPEAVVVHEGGASLPRPSLLPVLAESRIRYAHKHRSRAAAAGERLGVALGALTHAAVGRSGTRAGHLRALLTAAGLRRAPRPAVQEAGSD